MFAPKDINRDEHFENARRRRPNDFHVYASMAFPIHALRRRRSEKIPIRRSKISKFQVFPTIALCAILSIDTAKNTYWSNLEEAPAQYQLAKSFFDWEQQFEVTLVLVSIMYYG